MVFTYPPPLSIRSDERIAPLAYGDWKSGPLFLVYLFLNEEKFAKVALKQKSAITRPIDFLVAKFQTVLKTIQDNTYTSLRHHKKGNFKSNQKRFASCRSSCNKLGAFQGVQATSRLGDVLL